MTRARRAPELSAIRRMVSCCTMAASPYLARLRISATRQRTVLASGRVSTIRTVSPACASRSLRALTVLVRVICFAYTGCAKRRDRITVTVRVILSLVTTPVRVLRWARGLLVCSVISALVGSYARRFSPSTVRILAISRRKARNCIRLSIVSEAERKRSLNSSSRVSASLVSSCSTESSWSPLIIRVRFTSRLLAANHPRLERKLGGRERERLPGEVLGDAVHLEEDPGRLDHRHPALGIALALPHPRLGRLLGDRLVREDPDPDLAAPLHLAGHRHARRLDLPVGDPPRLQAHQPVFPERDGVPARGDAPAPALERLAELDPLGRQHRSGPGAVGAAGQVLDHFALEDPDLDADAAERGPGGAGGVVDVGPEGVERHPPLVVPLGPRDLRPAEPPAGPHLDALGAHPHGALQRALHRAAERDPLLQLVGDVVGDQLRGGLRPLDLLDVDRRLLAGELRQLVPELVHLGALLADHHAGPPGMDGDRHLARPALDVDLGDRRVAEPGMEVLADQLVLLEQRGHLLGGEPPGDPRLDDPEPEPDRIGLRAHRAFSFRLCTRIATWLVRFRIGVARPWAAAWIRLRGCPPFTIARVTTRSSTSNRSFAAWAFCSALATALLSVLAICLGGCFLLNLRIAYAALTSCSRIRSITSRILRGDWRTPRWIACPSAMAVTPAWPSCRRRASRCAP